MTDVCPVGYTPHTNRVASTTNSIIGPGDGDEAECFTCGAPADGLDARDGLPTCEECARIVTDGGFDRPRRLRIERDPERARLEANGEVVTAVGVQLPSGKIIVEWRTEAFQPEDRMDVPAISQYASIEDAEQGTAGTLVFEDEDREPGDRIMTDGGYSLYACDTPNCDGLKEVVTPDGYVCHDCADELEQQYENSEMLADGGQVDLSLDEDELADSDLSDDEAWMLVELRRVLDVAINEQGLSPFRAQVCVEALADELQQIADVPDDWVLEARFQIVEGSQ